MGRRAEFERFQQEPELLARVLFGDVQQPEHLRLDLGTVNADAAAADLGAVQHNIIGPGSDLERVGFHELQVFFPGRGKGMVHGVVALLLGIPLHQREVRDPEEIELILVNELQPLAQEQPQIAQCFRHDLRAVGNEHHEVARFCVEPARNLLHLAVLEELYDRRFKAGIGHLDPGQSLCPEELCLVREVVHLFARKACHLRRCEAPHLAAQFHCLEEDLKVGGLCNVRDVFQFESETGVGFVRSKAVHGLVVGKPREGALQFNALDRFKDHGQQLLHERDDVVLLHKGQLKIDLGELGLAVRAEVLVAEALHDLVVTLEPGDHQDLFKKLRRLRQRVEHAGIDPARDQIVPRALGRALGQKGRLDIDEPMVVEEAPHGLGDGVAQHQHLLEAGPPKVQVAVFEPEALGHIGFVLDHERQGF